MITRRSREFNRVVLQGFFDLAREELISKAQLIERLQNLLRYIGANGATAEDGHLIKADIEKSIPNLREATADEIRRGIRIALKMHAVRQSHKYRLAIRRKARDDREARDTHEGSEFERLAAEARSQPDFSGRLLSLPGMNQALRFLDQNIEIPEAEIKRLQRLLPDRFTEMHKHLIKAVQQLCEDQAPPLMMQLPQVIRVNGETLPFNLTTMQEVLKKAGKKHAWVKALLISDKVSEEIRSKTWNGQFSIWTGSCIAESKNRAYWGQDGQLEYKQKLFGESSEVKPDIILAALIRHLQTKGKDDIMLLQRHGIMRLDALSSDGGLLCFAVTQQGFHLESTKMTPDSYCGVGACIPIL